jgi:uncharacterized protein YbaA (DUF1428 family)
MRYVNGYVLAVPKKNLGAYRKIAQKAGTIWKEHGALEYRECAGDDLDNECGTPYPRLLKLKRGDTVVFAWIVFKSRADCNRVNTKVMKDPRLAKMFDPKKKPIFDYKRMTFGGFTVMVDA